MNINRFGIVFTLLLSACITKSTTEQEEKSNATPLVAKITKIKDQNSLMSIDGKEIKVTELHPQGMTLSDVIITAGKDTLVIRDSDPLKNKTNPWRADLDNNGVVELYFITESGGSGSFIGILGVTLHVKGHLIKIDNSEWDNVSDLKFFKGYRGKDMCEIEYPYIKRSFPVYLSADDNAHPSGGMRSVYYALVGNSLKLVK